MSSHHHHPPPPTHNPAPGSVSPRSLAPKLQINEPSPGNEPSDPFTRPQTHTREVTAYEEGGEEEDIEIEGSTEVVFGRGRLPSNKTTNKVSKGPSSPTPLGSSTAYSLYIPSISERIRFHIHIHPHIHIPVHVHVKEPSFTEQGEFILAPAAYSVHPLTPFKPRHPLSHSTVQDLPPPILSRSRIPRP